MHPSSAHRSIVRTPLVDGTSRDGLAVTGPDAVVVHQHEALTANLGRR